MKLLNVAKAALYGIFLNYYCYYVLNGAFIPRGTVIFFAIACVCVGMDMFHRRYVYVGTEFRCWLLYAALALVTTALFTSATGTGYVSDIAKYVQRVLIAGMVAYICEQEKSIRFGLRLMAVTAVACAIAVLLVLDNFRLKLDLSSGANLSANDTGAIMAFGCFAVLFAVGKRDRTSLLITLAKAIGIICCVTVIFLAGSRKSIIAVIIMLVLLLLCSPDYLRRIRLSSLIVIGITCIAAYLFVKGNLLPYAEQTNLYARLFGRGAEIAEQSDNGRMRLYVMALEDFVKNPFFGLGFNQFNTHHGNYTHSTYVEPLACSGLIGLVYLYPYISMVKKQILLIRENKKGSTARLKQKELMVYLCMFLFIGIGIPFMYKDVPCILLGTFVASQHISLKELKQSGQSSATY